MNRYKLLTYKIATVFVSPILLLLLMEFLLRIVGVGYDTDVFVEKNGVVRANWPFTFKYFPWSMARPMPPVEFSAEKPDDTLRVFMLGGSAAQGFPFEEFGMAGHLQTMLERAYDDRKVEVINTAITAINSHVVLPIARACLEYDPDFIVVYLGNNEVVGPHGAGTVFSKLGDNLSLMRLGDAAKASRLYQLLVMLAGRHKTETGTWLGMEFFLRNTVFEDDPRLSTVYDHFERNLIDIISTAEGSDCRILVSTVGVNLSDNPPFASKEPAFDEAGKKRSWETDVAQGDAFFAKGRYGEALTRFESATERAPEHAETFYRLGLACLRLGDESRARDALKKARDLDGLRFRADSEINSIIRQRAGEAALLVDIERMFDEKEFDENGEALFYDHVHLSFAGNYEVARAMAETIVSQVEGARNGIPSLDAVEERLAYSPWDALQVSKKLSDSVLNKPPFTNQLDHARRHVQRVRETRRLSESMDAKAFAVSNALYEKALALDPDDPSLHLRYSRLLAAMGEKSKAYQMVKSIANDHPHHYEALLELSALAASNKDFDEAELAIRAIQKINPFAIEPRWQLLYSKGDLQAALEYNEELVEDHPKDPDIRYAYALVLSETGKTSESIAQLRETISIDTHHAGARAQLIKFLRANRDLAGAAREARSWIEVDPQNAEAHFSMAEILGFRRKLTDSAEHYAKAIALNPDLPVARSRYIQLMLSRGELGKAIQLMDTQLKDDPYILDGYVLYGMALDMADRKREAIEAFRTGLKLQPDSPKLLRELAWVLATSKSSSYRNGPEAVELAEKLVKMVPDEADFRNVLAAAYAETRDFERAKAEARIGLGLAKANNQADLHGLIVECIGAFERKQPLRSN